GVCESYNASGFPESPQLVAPALVRTTWTSLTLAVPLVRKRQALRSSGAWSVSLRRSSPWTPNIRRVYETAATPLRFSRSRLSLCARRTACCRRARARHRPTETTAGHGQSRRYGRRPVAHAEHGEHKRRDE